MNTYKNFSQLLLKKHVEHLNSFPSKKAVHHFIDELLALLFPHFSEQAQYLSVDEIKGKMSVLRRELTHILHSLEGRMHNSAGGVTEIFFEQLPHVYELLWSDAQAIYEGDPAAETLDEVISAYPGFYAIYAYRIAHIFYEAGVPVFPRLITEYAHYKSGVDIHPGARIGHSFFIDHATGIVIGETTEIGNNVKIYQGVTIGALSVSKALAQKKRHPTIEDNVIIYSSATILGGETVIGHDSIIGGNVWLTKSVPPFSIVYNTSEIRVRSKLEKEQALMFHI
ncbi:serine O-acetyltransferase EpsC [Caldithrix abyssi]|uniref:Serine O-acetyltransferase n=1 Tax=Caldithrix abyssi DSM 13497 TaxID=880073 RepID=H1XNH5_CALAY|nr:serine O-acetyltransferase EpsC [Caldithrix abyssi]APF18109.1 serine O-acetyltransferase [Caldithrix abyssi DSM 13497]EHO42146.1 serine O-acetyltransferase [Caldithrix abyssi DSM 13497]